MDRLPLTIFARLSDPGLDKILRTPPSERDQYDDLIFRALLSGGQVCDEITVKEVLHYSKMTNGQIRMGDKGGLRQSLIVPTAKASLSDHRYVGGDLTQGFGQFQPASAGTIFQTDDVNAVMQSIGAALSLVTLRRILLLLAIIPLSSANYREFPIERGKDRNWVLGYNPGPSDGTFGLVNYTGFRFETLVTAPPASPSYDSYYSVVNQQIGDLLINFTAEIDAAYDDNYIELKTHNAANYLNTKQYTRKLLTTYCQTKLIGCNQIIFGFRSSTRSKKYKLNRLKRLQSRNIPKITNLAESSKIYVEFDATKSLITCTKLIRWYICVMTWIDLNLNLVRHHYDDLSEARGYSICYMPMHNASLAYLDFGWRGRKNKVGEK